MEYDIKDINLAPEGKQLQNIGYISYVRGRITVRDRAGLEDAACECYQTVRGEYERRLPGLEAGEDGQRSQSSTARKGQDDAYKISDAANASRF